MEKEDPTGRVKVLAPYGPFITFENSLKRLEQAIPPVIDKSLWSTQSGGGQKQLMEAYKFLGLIDDAGTPTTLLHELVEKQGSELSEAYKRVVENSYKAILDIPISRATSQQVESEFSAQFSVDGETRRKAISFFQKLAEKAGITVSPHLKPTRTSVTRRNVRARTIRNNGSGSTTLSTAATPPIDGSSIKIELVPAGIVTVILSSDVNPFLLDELSDNFLTQLKAHIQKYKADRNTLSIEPEHELIKKDVTN